jgi:hypothetical protein
LAGLAFADFCEKGIVILFSLRSPCSNCPFRKGVGETFQLSRPRLREIKNGVAFQCHKSVDYDNWDDDVKRQGNKPQQCAGLMAVLAREGKTNNIMQIAERFGHLDLTKLDPRNEAYSNWREVLKAHGHDA